MGLKLYNTWCGFWLVTILLLLYPLILICIQVKPWKRFAARLTNFWADAFFFLTFKKVEVEYQFKPQRTRNYIFVANHFSYLDIPVMTRLVRHYFSFMGKSTVRSIPLVGYMFRQLHIEVNRSNPGSRFSSLIRSSQALKSGRSLVIMPEGGIYSKNIPQMSHPFKDGAFLLALQHQVPVVPVTLVNLYKIMPSFALNFGNPKVVVHREIDTNGLSVQDLPELKQKVFEIIQSEINRNIG